MHYVINNRWALGDTVCLSAMARDFDLAYHGKHTLSFTGHYGSFWRNNPHVTQATPLHSTLLKVEYHHGMDAASRGDRVHFVTWFHKEIQRLTGLRVPVTKAGGDIHLTQQEALRQVEGRYWVVVAGGKLDMTAKWWLDTRWQETVDRLKLYGINCVQAGAHFTNHVHAKLKNCLNVTGMTDDVRELFTLIKHSEGVICGVTGPMHIAAAFEKPCVVLAGGREAPAWEAYVNDFDAFEGVKVKLPHKFLHTVGLLPCAKEHGCWKTRTVAIEAADLATAKRRDKLCTNPVRDGNVSIAACMKEITVDHVVEAVMAYYEEGRCPPIGKPKFTYPAVVSVRDPHELKHEVGLEHVVSGPMTPVYSVPIVESIESTYVVGEVVSRESVRMRFETPKPPQLNSLLEPAKQTEPNRQPREFVEDQLHEDPAFKILDQPLFGGRVTIFVLSHGNQTEFFVRCINGIISTVPAHRREIRVALNQPSDTLRQVAYEYQQSGAVSVLNMHHDPANKRRKYPAMRTMFYDPERPITTKYLVWFDDDSYPVDPRWLPKLAEVIVPNHREGARLFGKRCIHDLQIYNKPGHNPRQWFEAASWWKGQPLKMKGELDRVGPNGSCIDFVAGWFWAADVAAIKQADIPDATLNHNGGDITIGAQMRQAGFKIKDFNQDKRFVFTPPKLQGGRRGYSEPFPWADPASKAAFVEGS